MLPVLTRLTRGVCRYWFWRGVLRRFGSRPCGRCFGRRLWLRLLNDRHPFAVILQQALVRRVAHARLIFNRTEWDRERDSAVGVVADVAREIGVCVGLALAHTHSAPSH